MNNYSPNYIPGTLTHQKVERLGNSEAVLKSRRPYEKSHGKQENKPERGSITIDITSCPSLVVTSFSNLFALLFSCLGLSPLASGDEIKVPRAATALRTHRQ